MCFNLLFKHVRQLGNPNPQAKELALGVWMMFSLYSQLFLLVEVFSLLLTHLMS
jgi:hypothetical protein